MESSRNFLLTLLNNEFDINFGREWEEGGEREGRKEGARGRETGREKGRREERKVSTSNSHFLLEGGADQDVDFDQDLVVMVAVACIVVVVAVLTRHQRACVFVQA